MKAKQMELMKVIQFPQSKIAEKETREKGQKLEVAYKLLKYLVNDCDAEINIIVDIDKANGLFEISESDMKNFKYLIITSNYENTKKIKLSNENRAICFEIEGNEL